MLPFIIGLVLLQGVKGGRIGSAFCRRVGSSPFIAVASSAVREGRYKMLPFVGANAEKRGNFMRW